MDSIQERRTFLKHGAAVGAGLALGGMNVTANGQTQNEALAVFDVIKKRRSVRKFKSTPVPQEHITMILEAANSAPSSGNAQNWKFLVIQDRKKIDQVKEESLSWTLEFYKKQKNFDPKNFDGLKKKTRLNYENYLSAPVYIEVLVDSRKWSDMRELRPDYFSRYTVKDGALAAANLMLAARALGYGTVFCTDTIPEEVTKKIFNIPGYYTRICFTPVGVPDRWPDCPPKKGLDEKVVYDKFQ